MKVLTAYFSAEGTTAAKAADLSKAINSDIFEIRPVNPYTAADLRWTNPLARCNREKFGNRSVPVEGKITGFDQYDTVIIGFPIWYGCAPNVVNTFCSGYDWSNKKIVLFATSGGSGIGKTADRLMPYVKGGQIAGAKLITDSAELIEWVKGLL